jgi:hypothetical protein
MKSDAIPRCKLGERNALCPYYEGCLDHAVKRRWRFWDCSVCLHRTRKQRMNDLPMVKDPDPEYHIAARGTPHLAVP